MTVFMDKSDVKEPKRLIDVKLVNKGQNYDPFYPILQQLSNTIFARNRARKLDKIFYVISNPGRKCRSGRSKNF